ncbi:MAG TPA: hypothetical protein VHG52_11950, partial [Thermomicrobiales bacterium]|nr:hypothetical protein [Thermomicrobiales bacterium]
WRSLRSGSSARSVSRDSHGSLFDDLDDLDLSHGRETLRVYFPAVGHHMDGATTHHVVFTMEGPR